MTWEELEHADPVELLRMSEEFTACFPPLLLDETVTIGMAAHGNITTSLFALRALFASVSGNFELILVDDASPDETGKLFELVPLIHPTTQVFRFSVNKEYSGSLNTILSHAQGENILFLSNDIFVTPSYIGELLAVANDFPDAGIVRGCANFVDNGLPLHTVRDCGELDNFNALFGYAHERAAALKGLLFDDQFLTGDAFLVTRSVLNRVGYLDPRFYGYFSDHDFGVRARQAGFNPKLAAGAFAWHQHGSNMDYLSPQAKEEKLRFRWARVNENWARFKEKYELPVSQPYAGMRTVPWDGLAASPHQGYIQPCDHAEFRLPHRGTAAWNRHRTRELAGQARKSMNAAQLDAAEQLCTAALALPEPCPEVLTMLGTVQVYQGKVKAGIATFKRALAADPTNVKAHSNLLLSMNYAQECSQLAIYRESRRWGELHGITQTAVQSVSVRPSRSRIRIGYLSPDLRRHSVGYFILPLLEKHDRSRFEIFCFSDVAVPDDMTQAMMSHADGWRTIAGLSNAEVEAVIREAAPDVLVDLAGHTGQIIRLPLFAHRLALVQVSWLGYPNTTGLSQMDYRLTDGIADPESDSVDRFYAEKLIRLPGGFLCYRPPAEAPDVATLPALANGYVTFGCFNMLPKIQDSIISAWCSILHQVPNSKLVLKNHYFRDAVTVRRLARKFARRGISTERLVLLPSDPDITSHLAQYGEIDIALDTFPYNGTTTTCEALWMGVPVLTLQGDRHASRVGASVLHSVGIEGFTAASVDLYINLAIELSSDLDQLIVLRHEIRKMMKDSLLCNSSNFTSSIESVFCNLLSKKI